MSGRKKRAKTTPALPPDLSQDPASIAEVLSIGHRPGPRRPGQGLHEDADRVIKTFQTNFLSLISHELRTPMMGIMNALSLLTESGAELRDEISSQELLSMARRNAQRLHDTLAMLLDLASLESGTFHPRLKEVHLGNLVHARMRNQRLWLEETGLKAEVSSSSESVVPVLADPKRLGRAFELGLHLAAQNAPRGSIVRVHYESRKISLIFELRTDLVEEFESAWIQALAGVQGGVLSPGSAFSSTFQSEEAFLSRPREGLGSEFLIIHEIMRLHHGVFEKTHSDSQVTLGLELPELSSRASLLAVLGSRVHQSSTGMGTVALALVRVPEAMTFDQFQEKMRQCLFRATDAVYPLPEQGRVALVMDDCKKEDAPGILARIERSIGQPLSVGIVSCPEEASDPDLLIELAEKRLGK